MSLLVAELQARAAAPLNVRNLAAGLGLTREQLTARLNRLVSTYAAIWCPQVDDTGRRVVGAQAKLYLTDPLLGWLGHVLRPGLAAPDFTRLTESTLAVALARVLDQCSPGRWTSGDTIGYIRTEAGNDVDLAPVPVATAGGDRATTPVESKWVSGGWRPEARVVEGRYAAGVLATKDVLDTSHHAWAVPAPMVSLLLE